MSRHLPPLGALRAFESAMRHGRLADAAAELHVTPSAVSHQIRGLEADLGIKLARREGRRLVPTAAGEAMLPGLREGFTRIGEAVATVRELEREGPVTLSVLQTFALHWLVPRLPGFERRYPASEVRLAIGSRPVDFAREDVDLAVRHGDGAWPGLRSDLLFRDALLPVASPILLSREPPLLAPEHLARHTLLASAARPDAWPSWLASVGLPSLAGARTQTFESTNLALQAAARGLGVAIAGRRLVRSLVEARWLVVPFRQSCGDPKAYWVTCPEEWAGLPRIRRVREWLLEEARAEED
ncbi:transcriptional regulator GcvA [Geminicoccaceae bacterium 1502E]|nr:transcriptional regulator GcvA [Geminicoccaceae bacterium 1502E]